MKIDTYPLVSIGVPIYNGGAYIRRALESLAAQNYPNLEIIISDNCSEDDTAEIVQEFSRHFNSFVFVQQEENKGLLFNFQYVLDNANGKYFLWAAHDDYWSGGYVSKCVEILENNENISVVQSQTTVFRDGPNEIPTGKTIDFGKELSNLGTIRLIWKLFSGKFNLFMVGVFKRQDLVAAYNNRPDYISSGERFLLLQMVAAGKKIETTAECTYFRQLSPLTETNKYSAETWSVKSQKELTNLFDFKMVKIADNLLKNNVFSINVSFITRLCTFCIVTLFKLRRSSRLLIKHKIVKVFGVKVYFRLQRIVGKL